MKKRSAGSVGRNALAAALAATAIARGASAAPSHPFLNRQLQNHEPASRTGQVLSQADTLMDGPIRVLQDSLSSLDQKRAAIGKIAGLFASDSTLRASITSAQASQAVMALTGALADSALNVPATNGLLSIYLMTNLTKPDYAISPQASDGAVRALLPILGRSDNGQMQNAELVGEIYKYDGARLQSWNSTLEVFGETVRTLPAKYEDVNSTLGSREQEVLQSLAMVVASRPSDLTPAQFDTLAVDILQTKWHEADAYTQAYRAPYPKMSDAEAAAGAMAGYGKPVCFGALQFLKVCPAGILAGSSVPALIAPQLMALDSAQVENSSGARLAGALLTAWCMMAPSQLDGPAGKVLEISSSIGAQMAAVSGQWFPSDKSQYSNLLDDSFMMFRMAARYRGQAIVRTLFEDNNLTQYGYYAPELLGHLFSDRGRATGKPLMLAIISKRNWDGTALASPIGQWPLDQFDVRVIEPGSDTGMVDWARAVSGRLGGAKFPMLFLAGHGWSQGMELKAHGKGAQPQGVPDALEVGDTAVLDEFRPLTAAGRTDIVFGSCSAGQGSSSLAQMMARRLAARAFGATDNISSLMVTFVQTPKGVEVNDVKYEQGALNVSRMIFDYRYMAGVDTGVAVARALAWPNPFGQAVSINMPSRGAAAGKAAPLCTIYDGLGKLQAVLEGHIEGDSYRYEWNAPQAAPGSYFAYIGAGKQTAAVKIVKSE